MELKRDFSIPLLGLCALLYSLTGLAQTTLKIAHFLPSGAPAQQRVLQPWCETLRQASNDEIKCQLYPAMQLGGTPAQLVDQVRNGIADIVWTAPGYSAGRFPVIETMELPFIVKDATSGSRAVWQFYQQYAQDEFKDYKVLAMYSDGGVAVHTAKKPINSIQDWQGLKLRSSTRLIAKTLAALGASAVAMPPGQVTEAISKGVIDGAMGTWEVILPTKLDEVSRYHAKPAPGQSHPGATVLMVLMNKRKFASLPENLQQLIEKNSGMALVERFATVWDDEAQKAQQKVLAEGHTVTAFNAEDQQKMREQTRSVEEEWIQDIGKKGLDGRAMLDYAREQAK